MNGHSSATPRRLVGIDLTPAHPQAVVASGAGVLPGALAISTAVAVRNGAVLAGAQATGTDGIQDRRDDVLHRFGERALLALWDTYFPARHLLAALLDGVRRQAEQRAGGRLDLAAIAHPPGWDQRQRDLLCRAAREAGLPDVRTTTTPQAAAWAPVPDPAPSPAGLLLVVELTEPGTMALLRPQAVGHRLVGHLTVEPGSPLRRAARALLAQSGNGLHEISEVRAVGAPATDPARLSAIAHELGGPLRVPAEPAAAVAIGALQQWLTAATEPPPAGPPPRVQPDADIVVQLAQLAAICDGMGQQAVAGRARHLGQAIYEHRMGIRAWTPDPSDRYPAVLQAAQELLRPYLPPGAHRDR